MSSGFVTETEIIEARKRRQDEWEKVRTAEQPLERPEEPYDGRSLYERLKEQKIKKDMEFEEAHKLKNLIRGLDDDEVQFLELVDQTKMKAEIKQYKEDERELKDFRNRVASLQQESLDKKIQNEIKTSKAKPTTSTTRPTQKSLLGVGIKRKNDEPESESGADQNKMSKVITTETKPLQQRTLLNINTNEFDKGNFKCIGILPGIGRYNESSDSEISSDSNDEPDATESKYDLVGRKRQKKKQCQEE
ncbi:PSME3-interacting protein [Teleopsis dalmanni]|uniref:PSME3-interacting protein n=1 Tax=Teleopsis dalmanni TaxID=139649 RepID=UPI0018CF8D77|nr:PSME3-interacting protein [Teleopsis dalmanni]